MKGPKNHLTLIKIEKKNIKVKKDLFLKYHCSLEIMPVFFTFYNDII